MSLDVVPAPADVLAAAGRVEGRIHRTPVLRCRAIDAAAGRTVLLKAEHLQRTGSYKARGALNHLLALREHGRGATGVVGASSGNHGQALAWAAREVGLSATIVVPSDISPIKHRAIEGYGARVDVAGISSDERLELALRLSAERGLAEVPPYDHPWTMAGQGTWLLESLEDAGAAVEAAVVPVSGGGLAAGTVLAAEAAGWDGRVVGVEPGGADDTRRSLAAGRRITLERPVTIADALRAVTPGRLTFEVNRRGLAGVATVEDDQIVSAMRLLLERAKQLVEPGGAAALAAVLAGKVAGTGPVLVILSGGNVGADGLAELLRS